MVQKRDCDYAIHMVHGMLLDRASFPGPFYTLVEQIWETEADFTLAGHNHLGFPDAERDGKRFLNPGALARLSNHPLEMRRPVQVIYIDLGGSRPTYEKIGLRSAPPGEDVLDRSMQEEASFREERLAGYLAEIKAAGSYRAGGRAAPGGGDRPERATGAQDQVRGPAARRPGGGGAGPGGGRVMSSFKKAGGGEFSVPRTLGGHLRARPERDRRPLGLRQVGPGAGAALAVLQRAAGANFISVWARTCRVTVELDDGTRIARLRSTAGKKENQYILQRPGESEQVYVDLREIPLEIIRALDVRKVQVDEHNSVELNFGAQLDGPFLLAENGAVRAKVIGQLGGVHILDWAQKSTATDLRRLREEEGQLTAGIAGIESALGAYAHLTDLETGIKQLEEKVARIEAITADVASLEELRRQWQESSSALAEADRTLAALRPPGTGRGTGAGTGIHALRYRNLSAIAGDLGQVEQQLESARGRIASLVMLGEAEQRLGSLETLLGDYARLVQLAGEISQAAGQLDGAEKIAGLTGAVPGAESVTQRVDDLVPAVVGVDPGGRRPGGSDGGLAGCRPDQPPGLGTWKGSSPAWRLPAKVGKGCVLMHELWQDWQEKDRLPTREQAWRQSVIRRKWSSCWMITASCCRASAAVRSASAS